MTIATADWLGCVADEIERSTGRRPTLEELFDDDYWADEPANQYQTEAELAVAGDSDEPMVAF